MKPLASIHVAERTKFRPYWSATIKEGALRTSMRIVFGQKGDSFQHLLGGWSHGDDALTWTIGHESELAVPRPRRRGTYRLILSGTVFIAPSVPFQRLFVQVNGTEVGRFVLDEPFVIEAFVPWDLVSAAEMSTIGLRQPDAARPRDVSDSLDSRWVAVALRELTLRLAPAGALAPKLTNAALSHDVPLPAKQFDRQAAHAAQVPMFRPVGSDWTERPVFSHFAEVVSRHPTNIAVEHGARKLTYVEAIQRAAGLAARIAATTAPGTRVEVQLPASFWLPIAILACLAAGRPCILIDADEHEHREGVDQATCSTLHVVHATGLPAASHGTTIVLSDMQPIETVPGLHLAAMQDAALLVRSDCDAETRIGIGEAAILHDVGQYIEIGRLHPGDRHLLIAPSSTTEAIRTILAAVLSGGTLCLPDRQLADPERLLRVVQQARITVLDGSLDTVLPAARHSDAYERLKTLRLLRIDGGVLLWNDVAVLRPVLPKTCHILYAHGTAATLTCLQTIVTMPSLDSEDVVPAGLPVAGFAVSVVGPNGRPVASNTVGTLLVQSPDMQRGLSTGQPAMQHVDGRVALVNTADPAAASAALPPGRDTTTAGNAVRAAWQSVLGRPPCFGETFGAGGGDSLKLIEFAVELENRLGRRLPMSLLTIQMEAAQIASALTVADPNRARLPSLLAHELVMRFESLGGYCEFGFVQRICQVEPYSLLRFAGTRPGGVVAALEGRFESFGDIKYLQLHVKPNNEYVVTDTRFGFVFHTGILNTQIAAGDMLARESKRLGFLADRMREDLSRAHKIYIFRSHGPHEDGLMLVLHQALRQHGPNRLVWVMSADQNNVSGSIQQVADTLIMGYVDPLAVIDAGETVIIDSWLQICSAAYDLF